MRKKLGRFVSFEGGEGSGKSTQVKKLATALKKRDIDCLVTREPGGSKGAEEIRKLLVEGKPGRWDALTEALLLFAARHDHVENTIKPALAEGRWVLCDRFADSTYAYQGAGGGLDRETVRRIESVAIREFRPELTLILDLPVDIGLERAMARAGRETRFEQFAVAFHEKMRAGYLDIARRARERCMVIDANGSEAEVAERILAAVSSRFGLK